MMMFMVMMLMVMTVIMMVRKMMVVFTRNTAEEKPVALLCPLPIPHLIILINVLDLGIHYIHCTNGKTGAQAV